MTENERETVTAEHDGHAASVDASATVPRPLDGRTVMITRAEAQAAEFAAELERDGARVAVCPTIEIVEPESYEPLDEAISNLYGYDWLIFTSVNGVDSFMRRFEAAGRDVSEIDELRVCAIGTATADLLRDVSVHVDVVPDDFKAEGCSPPLTLPGAAPSGQPQLSDAARAVARDTCPTRSNGGRAR